MKIYTDETKSERTAIEAVAVKATASVGRGSNALHYQVRDASGRWHCVVKKHNPGLPAIKKSAITWRQFGRQAIGESEEMAL
jgi:hypothetical protein